MGQWATLQYPDARVDASALDDLATRGLVQPAMSSKHLVHLGIVGGEQQRRASVGVRQVAVGSAVEQQLHDGEVCVLGREVQRRAAGIVDAVDVTGKLE